MKSLCFLRVFYAPLLAVVLALPATVQAQSELDKPYNLTIVVHVAENRLLTDVFRERIQRELHDGFQVALGDMGRVTVEFKHDRLADVLERGLMRSLNEWKDRSDQKTHFVLIDYVGGHYEIQTRQYDGKVGRASPVVRRDRTRDRDFVAKAAALLIKQDFGVLGTVQTEPEEPKNTVRMELRGGALGDMSRWVKKGDIFAVVPPEGGTSRRLRRSLLQVEEAPAKGTRDGLCVCRFFYRYVPPSISGLRCIKLGTVQTALRLRWMQQMPNGSLKPLDRPVSVEIRRYGFDGEETSVLRKSSDTNGVLKAVEDNGKIVLFDNIAFVRVTGGKVSPVQIPIALVNDQPVVLELTAANDSNTLFSIQKSEWQFRVAESLQMQASLFKALDTLAADPANRAKRLELAKSGRNRAKKDREQLLKDRRSLAEDKRNKPDLKTPLEDQSLEQIEKYEKALAEFISKLEEIDKTENDPKRKQWLSDIESAKLLEKDLELGKAIDIYQRIQKQGFKDDDGKLAERLKELRQLWDLREKKGLVDKKEHGEARGFIYRVWPTLETARLGEKIPDARKAFQKCKDVGDLIAIQKLLKGTEGHAVQLTKRLDELRTIERTEEEKERDQLKKVSEDIATLGTEIQDYLKTHADDK